MYPRFKPAHRRRAATAVLVVVAAPLITGFAALTIDVGMSHLVRAELQRTADAAALAAAQDLGGINPTASMEVARASALEYVQRNPVLNERPVLFDPEVDLVFGRATLNAEGTQLNFAANEMPPNALRVTVHYELDYTFARALGFTSRLISASAMSGVGPRDFMVVIDCSGSMTKQSVEAEVEADLAALGIPVVTGGGKKGAKDPAKKTALALTYDGSDPEFAGVYAIGEKFLPPSIRIQPLKATKDAAAFAIDVVKAAGYDDLIGAVAYSSDTEWVEPLTTDYDRVRAKLRGATKYGGTSLHAGIQSAREELQSVRARSSTEKVIVLMTDGKSDATLAMEQAQIAVDAGMTIHVVGLGTDIDYALMNAIAEIGGGVALYVDNTTDPEVYGPELKQVFQSIASDEVGTGLIQ